MLPGNLPLAFCTILVRKVIDSYTGVLPVVASSAIPTPITAAVLSGALIGLYHQLRKGTLVKIGVGRKVSSFIRNSRHTIQRRVPLNSWFLKNAHACRRRCTEAMRHLARQSSESLEQIQRENAALPEINSLPDMRRTNGEAQSRRVKQPTVTNLFNRDISDNDNSCIDLTLEDEPNNRNHNSKTETAKQSKRSVRYGPVSHRPITRHFHRRNTIGQEDEDTGTRSPRTGSRIKTKSLSLPRVTKTTVEIPVVIRTDHDYQSSSQDFDRTRKATRKASLHKSRTNYKNHLKEQPESRLSRRKSEQIGRTKPIQKVTRKTRSGRIYAYRI